MTILATTDLRFWQQQPHFQALREQSGTDFSEMLFFDDEMRNIRECSALGVECVFVEQGLNREVFDEGWKRFSNG